LRKPISKRVRFEVFKRDSFTCQYCGAHPPEVILEVDHVHAVANGGSDEIDNLVTACEPCNRGKSAEPLTSVPETLAAKAQRIKEAEEQLAEYQAIMRDRAQRIEEDAWEVAERLEGQQLDEYNRAYLLSIKRFVETLGAHEVSEAADIALARRPYYPSTRFKYFCGICWKKIRDHGL